MERTRVYIPLYVGRHTRPHLCLKKKPGVRRSRTNLNLRKKASVCCLEVVQPCPGRLEIKMESAKQVKTGKRLSSVTRLHIINEEAIEIDVFLSLFLFARAK